MNLGMLCGFTCCWIGGWTLAGCILTAVDGVHAYGYGYDVSCMDLKCSHVLLIGAVCFAFQGLSLNFIALFHHLAYCLLYYLVLSCWFHLLLTLISI